MAKKERETTTEKEFRGRGWVIQRRWNYDTNDPTSKYHGVDRDTWREGVIDEWSELAKQKKINWCNFIVHDKDEVIDDDGNKSIKEIHMHAVVKYVDAKTQPTAMRDFCGSNDRFENCMPVDSQKGGYNSALLYLTHLTVSAFREYKTWYHHTDVHQFKARFLDLIRSDKADKANKQEIEAYAKELCDKVGTGELKVADAKKMFKEQEGAYMLTKFKAAFESADDDYKMELIESMQRISALGQFRKRTTYVSGPGRVGKTLLAESLAVDLYGADEVYVPATGGSDKLTDDFVDLYRMQKSTVFSDLNASLYYRGFLNMFDPFKWSPSKSRNKSKPWLSTDCYIADNRPVGEFMILMINGWRSKEMIMGNDEAMQLIMGFGRIARILTYGEDSRGNKVVWLGQLKPEFPTPDELFDYAKTHSRNMFDSKIVGAFYDVLGCVPYDKSAPIVEDRFRMANIINKVYAGDLNTYGFVKTQIVHTHQQLVLV